MNERGPLDELLAQASRRRSGELICASSAGEVHVYLQDGRIAWATDGAHPFAFAAHLQEVAGIDVDTFRHVVEECRRDKLSLGETLVAWGLATWDLVRGSLAHQIRLAIAVLARMEEEETAKVLFLERGYRTYDEQLTFDVRDFVGSDRAVGRRAPAPAPALAHEDLATQLRASVEGLSWVEIVDDEQGPLGEPPPPATHVPMELVRATLLDGADFVAVRAARTSVIGMSVRGSPAPRRSVWCLFSAESTFGAVVSALGAHVAGASTLAPPARPRGDDAAWTLGREGAPINAAVRSFMLRAQEVLGAVVLAGDPTNDPVAGAGCRGLDPRSCVDVARRRLKSFRAAAELSRPEENDLASIGFYLRTLVSGEPSFWCFGAELLPAAGKSLWMFLDRTQAQGLGWACLSALTRELSHLAPGAAVVTGAPAAPCALAPEVHE